MHRRRPLPTSGCNWTASCALRCIGLAGDDQDLQAAARAARPDLPAIPRAAGAVGGDGHRQRTRGERLALDSGHADAAAQAARGGTAHPAPRRRGRRAPRAASRSRLPAARCAAARWTGAAAAAPRRLQPTNSPLTARAGPALRTQLLDARPDTHPAPRRSTMARKVVYTAHATTTGGRKARRPTTARSP